MSSIHTPLPPGIPHKDASCLKTASSLHRSSVGVGALMSCLASDGIRREDVGEGPLWCDLGRGSGLGGEDTCSVHSGRGGRGQSPSFHDGKRALIRPALCGTPMSCALSLWETQVQDSPSLRAPAAVASGDCGNPRAESALPCPTEPDHWTEA